MSNGTSGLSNWALAFLRGFEATGVFTEDARSEVTLEGIALERTVFHRLDETGGCGLSIVDIGTPSKDILKMRFMIFLKGFKSVLTGRRWGASVRRDALCVWES